MERCDKSEPGLLSDTRLREMNQGVDSVYSQEGRKERRMDKSLTKVNKNPVRVMIVGRQEWEEMKKHSGSFLMDHVD